MKWELPQRLFRPGFPSERRIGSGWAVAEYLCLLPLDWIELGEGSRGRGAGLWGAGGSQTQQAEGRAREGSGAPCPEVCVL